MFQNNVILQFKFSLVRFKKKIRILGRIKTNAQKKEVYNVNRQKQGMKKIKKTSA